MFRRVKRDANESAIRAAYLDQGATWTGLDAQKPGTPDAVVGKHGVTDLVEVKVPRTGRIAPAQAEWHRSWRGSTVRVVMTVEDVVAHIADMRRRCPLRGA